MKKLIIKLFPILFLLSFLPRISAQQNKTPRCGTMEGMERYFELHPEARKLAESNVNKFAPANAGQSQRTHAIVDIPVVFHIVGSTTRQAQVTDADILWQLNKLNEDFSGANADSTNASAFFLIRAKKDYCQIRFCLAKRTPANTSTSGINRVVSSLTSTQNCNDINTNGNASLIKHASSGGADAWDPSQYFNIWVGELDGCVLGIATLPGLGPANEQGIVVDFSGFSNNPVYVDPDYNRGRTAVHESGHYFGLFHIWGDEAGCSNSDFRQLPGTCILPAGLAGTITDQSVGDTPNQASETTSCPSGVATDACATLPPGKNYQNYMDYSHDACYSMFTVLQVDRMQWVLDNCRASLKSSNGCDPLPVLTNDAGVVAINRPGSRICSDTVSPEIVIKNFGMAPLTSVQITCQFDGAGPMMTLEWTGNLSLDQTAIITFPVVNLGPAGNHSFLAFTSLPNNVADENPSNDELFKATTVYQVFSMPANVKEEFTSTVFPPENWSIFNLYGDLTWQHNASVGNKNIGSAWFNDYINTSLDRYDDLLLPNYSYSGIDSIFLTFNVASIRRTLNGNTGGRVDTLQVLLSKDCGNNFTTVYKKWGYELQTVTDPGLPVSADNFVPTTNQWRRDSVNLGKNLGTSESKFILAFRFSGNIENNLYLDDVNIRTQILPPRLKNDGFLVLPNPFRNVFAVWHYQTPSSLRYILVYNAAGQRVWSRQYSNGGEKYIQIDLSARATGMYTVIIGYANKKKTVNVPVIKY